MSKKTFCGGHFEILAAIIKIKRSIGVLSDSMGFHDPENRDIDFRIVLLRVSHTKL